MEDETSERVVLLCLNVTNIEEFCQIEEVYAILYKKESLYIEQSLLYNVMV